MDAACELSELFERGCKLLARAVENRARCLGVGQLRLREPQAEGERDEPLLGAVVEVPLQPPPLVIAGLHHPGPRRLELFEPLTERRLQTLALELRGVALGEIADEHDDFIFAAWDDACLKEAREALELELVLELDRAGSALFESILDAVEHGTGNLTRKDVPHVPADHLVGRQDQIARTLCLDREVHTATGHAEHEIRQGVDDRPQARLGLRERSQALLVLERKARGGDDSIQELWVLEEEGVVNDRGDALAVSLDDRCDVTPVAERRGKASACRQCGPSSPTPVASTQD